MLQAPGSACSRPRLSWGQQASQQQAQTAPAEHLPELFTGAVRGAQPLGKRIQQPLGDGELLKASAFALAAAGPGRAQGMEPADALQQPWTAGQRRQREGERASESAQA